MTSSIRLITSSILLSTFASLAQAETIKDAIGPGDSDTRWILSANVGSFNNIYAGEDSAEYLLPALEYNGDRFFVKDGAFSFSIGQQKKFTYGLTAALSSTFLAEESDYAGNSQLAGLTERDGTIEGGFYLNHTTDMGRFKLSLLSDLGGEHNGQRATASYTYDLKAGDWNINPSLGVQWMSEDIVNHQFGVSSAEATGTRAAYEGNSAFNFFAGVRARIDLSEHWDFSASTGFTALDNSITDSSIVDDDYRYYGNLSLGYKF